MMSDEHEMTTSEETTIILDPAGSAGYDPRNYTGRRAHPDIRRGDAREAPRMNRVCDAPAASAK